MAVPKGKRSHSLCRKRQQIVFYDQLDGNYKRRREWFYRRDYTRRFSPLSHLEERNNNLPNHQRKQENVPLLLTPFRFPGFWPGR